MLAQAGNYVKIVANPVAGRGRALRYLAKLRWLLEQRSWPHEILLTQRAGHAAELARRLAGEGCRRVIVLGGDGTISEVASGLLGTEAAMGLLPVGTGNDLARSLGIPRNDLPAALEILEQDHIRKVDVGVDGEYNFLSVLGVGFPVEVARKANESRFFRGSLAFFAGVYRALRSLRSFPVKLWVDGAAQDLECTSIMVLNTPYTGGGLYMAPQASMDDGKLDVVVVDKIGKMNLMLNFPRVYQGSHLSHPSFHLLQAREVRIESKVAQAKMFDGDIKGELPAHIRILERALAVVAPSPDRP